MSQTSPPLSAALPAPSRFGPLLIGCLAATWLVWGSTYLAIKIALESLPPFVQMGSRFLAAGALLMAWTAWRGAGWPTRRQWGHALVAGTLMLGGGMGGTAYAEQTVGSGLVVVFIAIIPVLMAVLLMAARIYPTRLEAAGIGLGLAGVVALTQGAGFQGSPAGLVAISIACLTWCIGSIGCQRWWPLAPGAVGYGSEMLCGGAVLMLLGLLAGEGDSLRAQWPPTDRALLAWLYLVVAGSLLAFNAYMVLLERAPAGIASSYCYVNPVIALALGVGLGGEQVSALEWAASAVALSGVVLMFAGQRPAVTRA